MASSVQIQWEQQKPDQLLQHEMEQKKGLQQLSSAVQQLEQKLTGIMAAQSNCTKDWITYCQVHPHLQPEQQMGSCAATQDQQAEAVSTSGRHPMETFEMLAESELFPDERPVSAGASIDSALCHSNNINADASCSGQTLSAASHTVPAEASKEHEPVCHAGVQVSCSVESSTQHIQRPPTAYTCWLNTVASVESASAQLQTQACRAVGSSAPASYAQLLRAQTSQLQT